MDANRPLSPSRNPAKWACPVPGCAKRFVHQSSLARHKSTSHSDYISPVNAFACDGCVASFTSQRGLSLHRSKSGHKLAPADGLISDPFACKFCDKSYPSEKSLTNHISATHFKEIVNERSSKETITISHDDSNSSTIPDPPAPIHVLETANAVPNRESTTPSIKRLRFEDLRKFNPSDWTNISHNCITVMSTLFNYSAVLLSPTDWLSFTTSVNKLISTIHSACLTTIKNASSTKDPLEILKSSLRTIRITVKTCNEIQKLISSNDRDTAFQKYMTLPLHVRLELPDFNHQSWLNKYRVLKKQLRRSNSRTTRKFKALEHRHRDTHPAKVYNVSPKKAMELISPRENMKCPIPVATIEDAYNKILASTPPLQPTPSWFDTLPWPSKASTMADTGLAFTEKEIFKQLQRFPIDSSPGPDGTPYFVYKKVPKFPKLLAHIFEICRINAQIPSDWNISKTILIYKKGDSNLVSNWRPISLQNSIYKIYAATLAKRLTVHAISQKTFSKSQKGFLPYEGCHEHTYVLKSMIEDARRWKKPLHLLWYDLKNAFGSVSHKLITLMMDQLRIPKYLQLIINDLYIDSQMYVETALGSTSLMKMNCGVKQGCPLSPLVFNMCLEGLLRFLNTSKGYTFKTDQSISISALAFADDFVTAANTETEMDTLFLKCTKFMTWAQVEFGVDKCASFGFTFINNKMHRETHRYKIQNKLIPQLDIDEAYKYLGTGTGLNPNNDQIDALLSRTKTTVKLICDSELEPWQKIAAIKTFALPQLYFVFYNSNPTHHKLAELDRFVIKNLRTTLNLPVSTSRSLFHSSMSNAGFGVPKLDSTKEICKISFALKLLSSNDSTIRKICQTQIQDAVTKRKISLTRSQETFLNWKVCNGKIEAKLRDQDNHNFWWSIVEILAKHKVTISLEDNHKYMVTYKNVTYDINSFKYIAVRELQKQVRNEFSGQWRKMKSQGRIMEYAQNSPIRNTRIRNSEGLTVPEYKFLLKYQVSLLPTRIVQKRYNPALPSICRLCKQHAETQNHILGHCLGVKPEITNRHHNVCLEIEKSLKHKWPTILVDQKAICGNLRPDLQLIDFGNKICHIIEVAVTFEDKFNKSIEQMIRTKQEKYAALVTEIKNRNFQVEYMSFVVGYSGSYLTDLVPDFVKISKLSTTHTNKLLRKVCTSAIKGSYNAWRRWNDCVNHSARM